MLTLPALQLPRWARERRLQMEGIASRLTQGSEATAEDEA
jgi:hypothetical protein